MKNILIIFFLFVVNCNFNKVVNNHGVHFLDKKQDQLIVNTSNKNDIINLLGPPSTKSTFNNDKWIYIERRKTNQSLFKLGIKKIEKNNILIVEFNKMGILKDKKLLDLNDMNDIQYVKLVTEKDFKNNNIFYEILSSMREKINAPTRNRSKK